MGGLIKFEFSSSNRREPDMTPQVRLNIEISKYEKALQGNHSAGQKRFYENELRKLHEQRNSMNGHHNGYNSHNVHQPQRMVLVEARPQQFLEHIENLPSSPDVNIVGGDIQIGNKIMYLRNGITTQVGIGQETNFELNFLERGGKVFKRGNELTINLYYNPQDRCIELRGVDGYNNNIQFIDNNRIHFFQGEYSTQNKISFRLHSGEVGHIDINLNR